ncbi:alpha/beta fold hydrolase [Ferrimonas aestuarii]|uniref:Alpha/beta hydrolase n=1 Tax=Ferrimonas aestuarii TaxID=2569539 RepID=A0A4U1BPQ4_9GAMM|nr:alpha/beta hydrolase [Ferrimonas aestuarii]TKB56198.1 alpha/beta hydrolase [Ferrimonas aestuarii]
MKFEHFGDASGSDRELIFCHANGFPPSTYSQLFEALGGRINGALLKPLTVPVTEADSHAWWSIAEELVAYLDGCDEPQILVGHSLGAVVSCLTAIQRPEKVKALVLLDPVFLASRLVGAIRLLPKRFRKRQVLVAKTLGRPNRFSDHQAAFEFHRGKRAYAGMDDSALNDYIQAAFVTEANSSDVVLRYSREWEAHIYQTPPWIWPRLRNLKVPTLCLRGAKSQTLTKAAFERLGRLSAHATLIELDDCGHLLPMERPQAVADTINDWLRDQK